MNIFLKQFSQYILHFNSSININNETYSTIFRLLFLFARFGDSLLLTCLPNIIKKYLPCWCHFNSKLLRKQKPFQRPSHQILMKNTDSSINEPISIDDSNDLTNQQENIKQSSRIKNHHFRLHFQFVPIWSKKRQRLFRENC